MIAGLVNSSIALLVTGASGMRLPLAVIRQALKDSTLSRIHVVVSKGAQLVLAHESKENQNLVALMNLSPDDRERIVVHSNRDLAACLASGSFRLRGTAVVPCSSATLAAFATGSGRNLIHRAGMVALKERWPLVLGFRETPLAVTHLENMRRLAYQGAVILPPIPAFYVGGESLERFEKAWALRVLDHLGVHVNEPSLRWPPEGESIP